MQYMLLIYTAESAEPVPGTPEFGKYMQGYMDFTEQVKSSGAMVAGDALEKVNTATTVRVRNGQTETTDGPFAETREVLGGYYLLECKDIDEAIACASQIPGAAIGSIEIRPVMVFDH